MDHLDISNTVDSTGALKVVGVATTDVSTCSFFLVWYIKRPLRKLHTKFFDFFRFISGLCFKVYLSSQNLRTVFAYERGKIVFSSVKLTVPVFSISSFRGISEFRKKKWRSRYR